MDKKELRQLSKNQLINLIFERDGKIVFLEKRLSEVERILKAFDNPHTPSSKKRKKNTEKKEGKPRFPGKPPGSGGGGIKLPPPDKVVEHTLDNCPECNNPLGNPVRKEKRTIIDLPEKLAITTEHHIDHYHCSNCEKKVAAAQFPVGIYGL